MGLWDHRVPLETLGLLEDSRGLESLEQLDSLVDKETLDGQDRKETPVNE